MKWNGKKSDLQYHALRLGDHTDFRTTEAYKMLRTNLLFTLASSKSNVVLFSSAEASVGKSVICANLAVSMIQNGATALIIDADMRKPVQHRIFQIPNRQGLSTLLSGQVQLSDVQYTSNSMSFSVITAGSIPPNPVELLGSQRMEDLLNTVSTQFDYVFVDLPPINILSDCLVLAWKTAGVVLVARQNQTTYDALQRAVESVKQAKGKVLGVVVNDVDDKHKPYGYKYGKRDGKYGAYDHYSQP